MNIEYLSYRFLRHILISGKIANKCFRLVEWKRCYCFALHLLYSLPPAHISPMGKDKFIFAQENKLENMKFKQF